MVALLACALFLPAPAGAALPEAVALALQQAGIPDSHVAVVVQDLDAATPLLAHGENRSMNPASVMKLVTTLAVLDSLGPAHTFKTRVWLDGKLEAGVLQGNLILQGGGDPGLSLERFWLLLRELRARGIREIRGDVVLDGSYYNLDPIDPAAFDQAPLRPYNAPPAALLVNFNTLDLRLSAGAGGITAQLEPAPAEAAPALVNQLQSEDIPCNGGWREQLLPRRESGSLILAGRYPLACGDQAIALNLLPPEATVAAVFGSLWKAQGGVLTGRVVAGGAVGPEARLALEFDSPPVAGLVRDVNKFSNNVMAKMLLLDLGAARFGTPATWDKGARAVRAWAAERGLAMPELVLENGSGLSRIERISAASLARLLTLAASRPAYYEFAASLPAVGVEGTQKKRLNGGNGVGMAWLKTGSLNGARNLAGYVLGSDGRRRVLVMLINHANAAAAGKAQDALVAWAIYAAKPMTQTASGRAASWPGKMEIKQSLMHN